MLVVVGVGTSRSLFSKRGVRFAYVPTTLLAQVDASVGGKTGVNFEQYKNMLGIIRQPEFTYVDIRMLGSLPYRDFLSGAADIYRAALFPCFNTAIKTLVDVQCVCGFFLCKTFLDAELPNALSALFYVIVHLHDLRSQICGVGDLKPGIMGIGLCTVAIVL